MASSFEKLTGGKTSAEKIAGGFRFTDGPVFSRLGYLLFSDTAAARIMQWEAGKLTVFREHSNGAKGLTLDHQGRLLTCERDRVARTEKNGAITVLADRCEGAPLHGPHDLVYAIDGTIYFTDAGRQGASLCRIDRKGGVYVASRDCRMPSGVALSPNQQLLYVGDTASRNIRVFDIAGDGSLKNGRVFAEARPGGLKTDEEGNLWIADGDAVSVFNARGNKLGSLPLPEPPSNCAWGEGFRDLYVTAGTSVYKLEANVHGTRTY